MLKIKNNNSEIVVNPFSERIIKYAFHDIDGTHSLIRNWPPVMSICLYDVIKNGLPDDFDSIENEKRLIELAGKKPLEETDRFCVESAGLSAITQMEWAIRRAIEEGSISVNCNQQTNSEIIKLIYEGEEDFGEFKENDEIINYINEKAPRLFRLYEAVLNGYCRDKNLEKAKKDPKAFQVKGSMDFVKFLYDKGVKNYFVTGAVVEKGKGMHQEVVTLGYEIGENKIFEEIFGSTWDEKMPKDAIMKKLIKQLDIDPQEVLVVGDGRSEISAGVNMGCVTISRIPKESEYVRTLHKNLGTNIIIDNYEDENFKALFE